MYDNRCRNSTSVQSEGIPLVQSILQGSHVHYLATVIQRYMALKQSIELIYHLKLNKKTNPDAARLTPVLSGNLPVLTHIILGRMGLLPKVAKHDE